MGRHAKGWTLKWTGGTPGNSIARVRFTHEKHQYVISTGCRDIGEASQVAKQIYLDVLSGKWAREQAVASAAACVEPIGPLLARWVIAYKATHPNSDSDRVCETYARTWIRFFATEGQGPMDVPLGAITTARLEDYATHRLTMIKRKTLRKELSMMRSFLRWCVGEKLIVKDALPVAELPDRGQKGVKSIHARKKEHVVNISRAEAEAFIAALPVTSANRSRVTGEKVIVRDFFDLCWETGLRPRTIGRLVAGRHFHRGTSVLQITEDIDKVEFARVIDLPPRAAAILERNCGADGERIFGIHDRRRHVKTAATASGMAPHKAAWFSVYDLRHGRCTYLLDNGASLTGVAYGLGHRHVSTTSGYAHPSREAALKVLDVLEKIDAPVATTPAAPPPAPPAAPVTAPGFIFTDAFSGRPIGAWATPKNLFQDSFLGHPFFDLPVDRPAVLFTSTDSPVVSRLFEPLFSSGREDLNLRLLDPQRAADPKNTEKNALLGHLADLEKTVESGLSVPSVFDSREATWNRLEALAVALHEAVKDADAHAAMRNALRLADAVLEAARAEQDDAADVGDDAAERRLA